MATNYFPDGSLPVGRSLTFTSARTKAIVQMPDDSVRFVTNPGRDTATEDITWDAAGVLSFRSLTGAVGGQLLLPDGTAAAPSLSRSGSADGLFFGNGIIRFSVLGVETARLVGGGLNVLQLGFNGLAGAAATLVGDGGQIIAQRNGTNAQAFRLYKTFTDASNFERLAFDISGSDLRITSEALGTGTVRNILIDPGTADVKWGKPIVALGGGAAPTFGTIGGSGPTAAAQSGWKRELDSTGAVFWTPIWR